MKPSFWGAVAISSALIPAAHSQAPLPSVSLDELGGQLEDSRGFRPQNRRVSDHPAQNYRVIIGEDERTPVLDTVYPYSAIGRLDWVLANGFVASWCTGTLIGPDLVLTNSHCLTNPQTDEFMTSPEYEAGGDRVVFKPNLIQGEAEAEAEVLHYRSGWDNDQNNAENDWALLRLAEPLGEQFGYLGWLNLDFTKTFTRSAVRGTVRVAGYAGDFPTEDYAEYGEPGNTAGLSVNCSIIDAYDDGNRAGLLFHQCDTNPGVSGSALFVHIIPNPQSKGRTGIKQATNKNGSDHESAPA
ncbi:MAG: trypsin-like serine protease [Spirulina sp. SIO3F2]|nr:trypsin-like serine protease [Spirulina sp. SIO3F2]